MQDLMQLLRLNSFDSLPSFLPPSSIQPKKEPNSDNSYESHSNKSIFRLYVVLVFDGGKYLSATSSKFILFYLHTIMVQS